MRYPSWVLVPAAVLAASSATSAFAVQYLTVEQAQQLMFRQAERFNAADLTITPELRRKIEDASGLRVRHARQRLWRAESAGKLVGWFVLDEVIGKHEFITYAVALTPQGEVSGVEILDYRETHGGEVRDARWRAQFNGKRHGAALALDEDIRNISGATLSCKNITNGVKRILATFEVALR